MLFEFNQVTNKLSGKTIRLDSRKGNSDLSDKSLFAQDLELDRILKGKIYGPGSASNNLITYFTYTLDNGQYGEISAGHVTENGTLIEGQFSNTIDRGKRGWFVMKKIENHKNEKIEAWKIDHTEKERRKILKLVDTYESSLSAKDKQGFLTVYLNAGIPVTQLYKKNQVITKSADEFADSLFNNKKWNKIAETLHDKVVHINGNIATLTTFYKWYVDDKFKAKGKKIWMLVKTDDGWKVNHHSWHANKPKVQEANQLLDENQQLSGRWVWEGRPMNRDRSQNNGGLFMDLNQINQYIHGDAYQFINPGGYSTNLSHFKIVSIDEEFPHPANEDELNCHINSNGQIFGPFKANENKLALIQRIQKNRTHRALFAGTILENGKTIEGHFTNTWNDGGKGWLVLRKVTNFTKDKGLVYEPYIESLDADRNEILSKVSIYEKSIKAKKRGDLRSICHSDVVISNVTQKDKIKDQTADDFMDGIVAADHKRSDTLYRKMVRVNGCIASLTAYYDWFNDSGKKRRGSVIFLLVKMNDGWRVLHKNWHN